MTESVRKALEAALKLSELTETLTASKGDDEYVWGVQEQLRAALSEPEWLPIESAPKDGTPVDLWCRDSADGGRATRRPDCRWGPMSTWVGEEDGWIGLWRDNHGYTPTHWRPLPPSPKGEGR